MDRAEIFEAFVGGFQDGGGAAQRSRATRSGASWPGDSDPSNGGGRRSGRARFKKISSSSRRQKRTGPVGETRAAGGDVGAIRNVLERRRSGRDDGRDHRRVAAARVRPLAADEAFRLQECDDVFHPRLRRGGQWQETARTRLAGFGGAARRSIAGPVRRHRGDDRRLFPPRHPRFLAECGGPFGDHQRLQLAAFLAAGRRKNRGSADFPGSAVVAPVVQWMLDAGRERRLFPAGHGSAPLPGDHHGVRADPGREKFWDREGGPEGGVGGSSG